MSYEFVANLPHIGQNATGPSQKVNSEYFSRLFLCFEAFERRCLGSLSPLIAMMQVKTL